MFNLAIDRKLRACDLVRLRIDDVLAGDRVRDRATVVQKKTGRPVKFEITEQTRSAIGEWVAALGAARGKYCFQAASGSSRTSRHANTRAIVHRWVERAGLDSSAYAQNGAGSDLQEDWQPAGRKSVLAVLLVCKQVPQNDRR
jgi:integrase